MQKAIKQNRIEEYIEKGRLSKILKEMHYKHVIQAMKKKDTADNIKLINSIKDLVTKEIIVPIKDLMDTKDLVQLIKRVSNVEEMVIFIGDMRKIIEQDINIHEKVFPKEVAIRIKSTLADIIIKEKNKDNISTVIYKHVANKLCDDDYDFHLLVVHLQDEDYDNTDVLDKILRSGKWMDLSKDYKYKLNDMGLV